MTAEDIDERVDDLALRPDDRAVVVDGGEEAVDGGGGGLNSGGSGGRTVVGDHVCERVEDSARGHERLLFRYREVQ